MTHRAAMQALRRLQSSQVLREMTGRERNTVYAATAILEILD